MKYYWILILKPLNCIKRKPKSYTEQAEIYIVAVMTKEIFFLRNHFPVPNPDENEPPIIQPDDGKQLIPDAEVNLIMISEYH